MICVRRAGRTAPALLPDLTPEVRDCLKSQLPNLKGTVLERSFGSQALGRVMRYVIYLPPGYNASGPGFPVLYMLHGRGGERTEWLSAGLLESVDRGIAAGKTTPMIVVVPEGQTGYWTDHAGSGPRWGEYIVSELTTHVDATYATRRRPSSRAIGGESMGGWGALHHGLSHPEVFGVVGAHSPSLRPDDGSLDFLGRGSEFAAKDPMALAARSASVGSAPHLGGQRRGRPLGRPRGVAGQDPHGTLDRAYLESQPRRPYLDLLACAPVRVHRLLQPLVRRAAGVS